MNLQITIEEKTIKDFLKQRLIGKNFGYCWDYDVKNAFDDFLKSYNIDTRNFSWQKHRGEKQSFRLTYKGFEYGYVEAKKQKVNTHHSWLGGTYCDWTFKDVNVVIYKGTLNAAIEDVEQRAVEKQNRDNAQEQAAIKIYKLVIENCKDRYEADNMIDYIKSHRYTLQDKMKKSAQA